MYIFQFLWKLLIINSAFIPLLYAPAMTFIVTNGSDSGAGSLRQAIINSNANNPAPDPRNIINFTFSGTISPVTDLPIIFQPVLIDGYTAPGAVANTNNMNQPNNAVITVRLNGPGAIFNPFSVLTGLELTLGSEGSIIRGIAFTNWAGVQGLNGANQPIAGSAITIASDANLITGNFFGVTPNGITDARNFTAIVLVKGDGNRIGDGTPAGRNLIAGQYGDFGTIYNQATNTIIQGNTIGLTRAGTAAVASDIRLGIVSEGQSGVLIGGLQPNERNVIAGHSGGNIILKRSSDSLIQRNYIGTDITGTLAIEPAGIGVSVYCPQVEGQPENTIIDGNLISGNGYGITIGENSLNCYPDVGVSIINNIIGLAINETSPIPNSLDGIWIKYGFATFIAYNTIASNGRHGIRMSRSKLTNIKSNYIGVNQFGDPLGNTGDGIRIGALGPALQSLGDIIGGAKAANAFGLQDGNLIQYNLGHGIKLQGYVHQATIQGNSITNNGLEGILIPTGSFSHYIGALANPGVTRIIGSLAGQDNVSEGALGITNSITGNGGVGIKIQANSNNNKIQSNTIDANADAGIELIDSSNNLVGAPGAANSAFAQPLGNSIHDNGGAGVAVIQDEQNAINNAILSNSIANNASSGIVLITQ